MSSKEFGFTGLLLFSGLIFVVLITAYIFFTQLFSIVNMSSKPTSYPNYKNAYTEYKRLHNIKD